mmetsp:Transcript_20229/g.63580  ORF Transcript_20229/g.63580 Transcript_20229/m.63580 type:complete len:261 (+) Transcript_20229:297-1079(+)
MHPSYHAPGVQNSRSHVPRLGLHALQPQPPRRQAGRHADDCRRAVDGRILLPPQPRPTARATRSQAAPTTRLRSETCRLHRRSIRRPFRRPPQHHGPVPTVRAVSGSRPRPGWRLLAVRRQHCRLSPLRRRPSQHIRDELPRSPIYAIARGAQALGASSGRVLRASRPHRLGVRPVALAVAPARRPPDDDVPPAAYRRPLRRHNCILGPFVRFRLLMAIARRLPTISRCACERWVLGRRRLPAAAGTCAISNERRKRVRG